MSEKPKILIVEDDPVQLEMAKSLLEPCYDTTTATESEEAIRAFSQNKPHLILMDKRLPGTDGVQLCRMLRQEAVGLMPPIIFLSAEVTLDDRLEAYSAGAEDYIAKPYIADELFAKIDVALRNVEHKKLLEGKISQAQSTAMTAMTSAGELGVVLQTFRESFKSNSLKALCQCMIKACENYQLEAVVQIRGSRDIVTLNKSGITTGLEMETLMVLADKGRIVTTKKYLVFNYGSVTILVRGLSDNDERTGRMRDNLALIAEAVDVRAQALDLVLARMREHQHTLKLFALSTIALQQIDAAFKSQLVDVRIALSKMVSDAEASFFSLGLTENQERKMSLILSQTENQLLATFEKGLAIEEHIGTIQKLMETREEDTPQASPKQEEDDNDQASVELF